MGLSRPRTFAGHVAWRCRALFDLPDRLSRHAIEHIRVALLGELHQRFDRLAFDRHVHEGRSGGEIVVPDVVVRDLVVPDTPAGFEIEANNGIAEEIGAHTPVLPVYVLDLPSHVSAPNSPSLGTV